MSGTKSNSRTPIADLIEKNGIEDTNLIIVEDNEDTKKSTVSELKKSFSGDSYDPDINRFYSSKKINSFINNLKRDINNRANIKEIKALEELLHSIVTSNGDGTKDTELIAARNGKPSLPERLSFDNAIDDSKYMEKLRRSVADKRIDIKNHYGYVDISIIEADKKETTASSGNMLTIRSKNLLNYTDIIDTSNCLEIENNGFRYTQHEGDNPFRIIEMVLPVYYYAGQYNFFSSIRFTDDFSDRNIKFNIRYSDGTIESFPYMHEEHFVFEAKKAFDRIMLEYSADNIVEEAEVFFSDIMLTEYDVVPTKYIPYERYTHIVSIGYNLFDFYNNNYVYECNLKNALVRVDYHDNDISTEYIYNELCDLRSIIENKIDHCGMITDYGTYQFLDNMYISTYEDGVIIENGEKKYERNGVPSKKITITEKAARNSIMRIPLDNPVEIIETFGTLFYMDRTDWSLFNDETGGIKIRLSSDDIKASAISNYYEYRIRKKEMVQGWNFIKKRITEFTAIGDPNPNGIKYIQLEICRTDDMNKRSLYINSFVFNQKMRPAVLLCLNGTYDESISYLYPYLQTRKIKPTLFLNSRRTLTPNAVDGILKYKIKHGWDIGLDSCHPNKEILTQDENYRNQYMALKSSVSWIKDNLVNNPISFSAAYGNLRPITVPLMEDFGFKIVKTDADGYCGFFGEKDLCLPMHLISNEVEVDDIIDMIDYAIETNQAVVLYTNDVTEYGSEIDSKKVTFESIIDYIEDRVEEGSIDCLTFKEFYDRCMN